MESRVLCVSVEPLYSHRQTEEMLQRRAAKYATNRYHNTSSMTDMLQELEWESLESKRVKIQLTLLFKVVNNLVDICSTSPSLSHTSQHPDKSKSHKKGQSDFI